MPRLALFCAFALWIGALPIAGRAQSPAPQAAVAPARTGPEMFRFACAACHGVDGKGMPQSVVGFDLPLPDFTDCSFSTVEPDGDWLAVTHGGGPARGFDRRMPAFGEALTEAEMMASLDHARTFCDSTAWPRGDLNLPRALVTEKAFPENEAVVTTLVNAGGTGQVTNEILYEKRFGPRNQLEVAVPLTLAESGPGVWTRGLGDVAIAMKRVLFSALGAGTIVSAAGEIVLPTGKETLGLGKGFTRFEPFVALGQILPRNRFVHAQVGAELPAGADDAAAEAFWRGAFGQTFEQGRFGRAWSPMVEVLGARELERGHRVQWDIVPQMQVTLNTRQHIMINAGVRIPVNAREGRHPQVITYFLWDWFDGGLREGW